MPQVEAIDKVTGQLVRLWPGEADALRQRARDGLLLCPVLRADGKVCGLPYGTTVNGHGAIRDHFRHASAQANDHAPVTREGQWHALAKQTVEEWARRHYGTDALSIGVEGPRLAVGRYGRTPDVRVERPHRSIVAIEVCSTSPATGTEWLRRHQDYRRHGVIDVWLLADIGAYGKIKVAKGERGRRDRLIIWPKGVAVEMLRRGVLPLWLHLPDDVGAPRGTDVGTSTTRKPALVGTPMAFGQAIDGSRKTWRPVTPGAVDVGSEFELAEDVLDECRIGEPPREELVTPARRRQWEGEAALRRMREREPISSASLPEAPPPASEPLPSHASPVAPVPAEPATTETSVQASLFDHDGATDHVPSPAAATVTSPKPDRAPHRETLRELVPTEVAGVPPPKTRVGSSPRLGWWGRLQRRFRRTDS